MSYGTIVVGTDGSETARRAEEAAARLAAACGARLVVVHAVEEPAGPSPVLREAVARAETEGIQVVGAAPKGAPEDAIVEMADRRDAGLIVLGNRGMGSAKRFLLGSVPDRISHRAPCDVLIVQTDREGAEGFGDYRTILIATDGSSTADRACLQGFRLARALDAGVAMLYVGHPVTGTNIIEETAARLGGGMKVRPIAVPGDPADVIVETAEREDLDLILVGNRGMQDGRLARLAAVPNKVSHQARRDLLIARTASLTFDDLDIGEGAVVADEGRKLAIYKDPRETVHVLSAKCTHLGCTVGWNATERTWDCPCHGSRYAHDGAVINGPATKPLSPETL